MGSYPPLVLLPGDDGASPRVPGGPDDPLSGGRGDGEGGGWFSSDLTVTWGSEGLGDKLGLHSELMLLPRVDGQGNMGDKLELLSDLVLLPSE